MTINQQINEIAGKTASEYLVGVDGSNGIVPRDTGIYADLRSSIDTGTGLGGAARNTVFTCSADGKSFSYTFNSPKGDRQGEIDTSKSYVRVHNTDDNWDTFYTQDINLVQDLYSNGFLNYDGDLSNYYETRTCFNNDGTYLFMVHGGWVWEGRSFPFNSISNGIIKKYHIKVRAYKRIGSGVSTTWEYKGKASVKTNTSDYSPDVLLSVAYGNGDSTDVLSIGTSLNSQEGLDGAQNAVSYRSRNVEYDVDNNIIWSNSDLTGGSEYLTYYRDHINIIGSNLHYVGETNTLFGGYGAEDYRFYGVYDGNSTSSNLPNLDFDNNPVCARYGSLGGITRPYYTRVMRQKCGNTTNIYSTTTVDGSKGLNIARYDYDTDFYEVWPVEVDATTYFLAFSVAVYPFNDDKNLLITTQAGWYLLTSTDNNPISSSNYTFSEVELKLSSFGLPDILVMNNDGTIVCSTSRRLFTAGQIGYSKPNNTIFTDVDGDDYISANDFETSQNYQTVGNYSRIYVLKIII